MSRKSSTLHIAAHSPRRSPPPARVPRHVRHGMALAAASPRRPRRQDPPHGRRDAAAFDLSDEVVVHPVLALASSIGMTWPRGCRRDQLLATGQPSVGFAKPGWIEPLEYGTLLEMHGLAGWGGDEGSDIAPEHDGP